MARPLGDLSTETFLSTYWQRRPCLVRRAFPDFEPMIDGDDLAGLACDPLAESRIVRGPDENGGWSLAHGPFDADVFSDLGESNWTLLVQDVDKHYPPVDELLAAFDFLPTWRLDDIMISFAAPGGSVGPHVDQYDVFLLQAAGRRRWRIALDHDGARRDDLPLDMLADFRPEEEWVLEPGDMLYLPPGVAHHGIALEAGLTYSIGLRAPSAADLFAALGEMLAGTPTSGGRYEDPPLSPARRPGEIDVEALARLEEFMRGALDASDLDDFLGRFLSTWRQAHEAAPPPRSPAIGELRSALREGARLHRNPWTRFTWVERNGHARLYAGGDAWDGSIGLAVSLCRPDIELPADPDHRDLETLHSLIKAGHLLVEPPE